MADQPALGGEGLIVKGGVKEGAGEIGAQRSADLHCAHRATALGSAANVVHQIAQREAEGRLEQAAVLDVARQLDGHGAARAPDAIVLIKFGSIGQDVGNSRQRQKVVDHGRATEQTFQGGQWGLGPHLTTLAFKAFQKRGFFAADIGARADPDLQLESLARARNVGAQNARRARRGYGGVEHLDGERIFGPDIDEALIGPDR